MKNRFKNYFAEFFGTTFLVLFGCGTELAVGMSAKQGSGYILSALAFGLAFAVMAYSICKKSGCHLNPASSLAFLVTGKMKLVDFIGYIVAQFAGSFLACGLLFAIFYGHTRNYAANVYYDANPWMSILIEVLLTIVFVVAVLSAYTDEKLKDKAGVIGGGALCLVHIFGIQLTGTSTNPARSLATAVFAGSTALEECWVFIVSPLAGAILAALIYRLTIAEPSSKQKTRKKAARCEQKAPTPLPDEENEPKTESAQIPVEADVERE